MLLVAIVFIVFLFLGMPVAFAREGVKPAACSPVEKKSIMRKNITRGRGNGCRWSGNIILDTIPA